MLYSHRQDSSSSASSALPCRPRDVFGETVYAQFGRWADRTEAEATASTMSLVFFFGFCTLLVAKLTLLTKILWSRDCTGISGKTQLLYSIIFATRYFDIVGNYYTCSLIVSLTKLSFVALTYSIVLSIFFFSHGSYQRQYDNFRIEMMIFPCMVLSILANYGFNFVEVFWAFSVYLESVAILPQLQLISRAKYAENVVYYYICLLSLSKLLYLMETIYLFYMNEPYDRISLAAGIVQLMFYCDFFVRDVPLRGEVGGDDEEAAITAKEASSYRCPKEAEAARSATEAQSNDHKYNNLSEIVLHPASLVADPKVAVVNSTEKEGSEQNGSTSVQT